MKKPIGKLANSATVGEKGQIVIPKQMRDMFGIHPGDTLLLLADQELGIAIPPKNRLTDLMDEIMPTADRG
ncbi:MAG: AbrB/MazE/SpoVT family DNA-binding domain-containing protein [Bifidobacterium sp.]|nr:AbrB/MazE/SpoVT family DNA-binding domain-containing protein [Bifidobacterium sp.]MCI1865679.1 AbrB/MazE/SpoVT family DNA-binding domain-containing protein [Bifidobacterium sp.]